MIWMVLMFRDFVRFREISWDFLRFLEIFTDNHVPNNQYIFRGHSILYTVYLLVSIVHVPFGISFEPGADGPPLFWKAWKLERRAAFAAFSASFSSSLVSGDSWRKKKIERFCLNYQTITFYILHFTFYILHFTFYILHLYFTFYILHFTFYILYFTFLIYILHFIFYIYILRYTFTQWTKVFKNKTVFF